MEKYITWYRLLLKVWVRKKSNWLQLAGMVLLVLLIAGIRLPDTGNTIIGICNQDGDFAGDVIANLKERESVFQFEIYKDPQKMKEAVIRGELETAFIFEKGMEEGLKKQKKNQWITGISTPLAVKTEVAQETVFAAFLERYSQEILLREQETVFGKTKPVVTKALLEKNQEYLKSDQIFRMDFEEVESDQKRSRQNTETFPVRGITVLVIFVMMLMTHGRKFEQKDGSFEKSLTPVENTFFELLRYLASATFPAVCGIILLMATGNGTFLVKEVLGMILFAGISAVWMVLAGKFFQNGITYASWIMTLVIANLLLCPIFFDLPHYVPAVRYINCIFPVGIYLKLF